MIKTEGGKFVLYSKDGKKKLGTFDTREQAVAREKQIQSFKESRLNYAKQGQMTEASPDGSVWEVVLLEAGTSENNVNWRKEALQESAEMFNDVGAFAYEYKGGKIPAQIYDHVPQSVRAQTGDKLSKNKVGFYSEARYGEFEKPDGTKGEGIIAKFNVTAGWLRESLKNAWELGKRNFLGFSIDAFTHFNESKSPEGREVKDIQNILRVDEVTVVSEPGAGGRFLRLAASNAGKLMEALMFDDLLKWMRDKYAHLVESIKDDDDDAAKVQKITEALKKVPAAELAKLQEAGYKLPDTEKKTPDGPALSAEEIGRIAAEAAAKAAQEVIGTHKAQESALETSRKELKAQLAESKLPQYEQDEIWVENVDKTMTKAEIGVLMKRKQDKLARAQESGLNVPGQQRQNIEFGDEEFEKLVAGMQGMLDKRGANVKGKDGKAIPRFRSIHESYRMTTGYSASPLDMGAKIFREMAHAQAPLSIIESDERDPTEAWMKQLRESRVNAVGRMQEAQLTTSLWAEVFGVSVRRQLMMAYDRDPSLDSWRKIVSNISSVPDFRNNLRQRIGGFGNLSTVSEGATYQLLDYPTDEEVSFAVQKRGALTELTMESLVNDDLRAVQTVIDKLGTAAKQTLHEFVFDFLDDNVTLDYDSTALFAAGHNNLGSTALSDAAFDDRVFAMNQQTEQDSGKVLGVDPKIIVYPAELRKTAWELTKASKSSQDGRDETIENWAQTFGLEPIQVNYWTDANNWYLVADPNRYPTIEIAFLGGRQEPEVFIQDQPNIGSVFTADKITYKIRHIYGGDVLEHRSFDGSVVT